MGDILNIRLPEEIDRPLRQLAREQGLPPSTMARILLRRALDEPIGLAVIKEKVAQIHAVMRARQAKVSISLREMLLEMVNDLAPEVERASAPSVPSAEELEFEAFEDFAPAPLPVTEPIVEDDDGDHGAGVVFGSARRKGDAAVGRPKRRARA